MAAILLSSTEFAQQLEAVGMPRKQAEVVAQGLAAMYLQNFDSLVTKDYLDTRFSEFEARIGREMDRRFAQVDLRFARVDTQFARVYVMQAIIMAALAVPVLQTLLVWSGG